MAVFTRNESPPAYSNYRDYLPFLRRDFLLMCALNFRFADDTPLVEDAAFPWLARDTPFGRNCYIFAEGEFLQQRAQ